MPSRLRRLLSANTTIMLNAGSLVGTAAITSLLGFVYWWAAARAYEPAAVGFSAAAISAMMLPGYLSMLGLGTLLIRELPREQGREASLIVTALLTSAIAGVGFGLVFAFISPWFSPEFRMLHMDSVGSVLFALGVSLTGMTLVLDQALIGLLRGGLQFWRNAIFAASKLALLVAVGIWWQDRSWLSIYVVWMIGNLTSVAALVLFGKINGWRVSSSPPRWSLLRRLGKSAIAHHSLNLSSQAPSLILPLIVTAVLSAQANAYFYMSSMVSSFVFVGTAALATALYAVGSRDPDALAHRTRFTLGLSLLAAIAAGGALIAGASWILGLFGHEYAQEATASLQILVLAAFPLGIKAHYAVIWRIRGQLVTPGLWLAAGALLELSMAAVGARMGGLTGLSIGWVIATCLEAGCMSRTVCLVAFPQGGPMRQVENGGDSEGRASTSRAISVVSSDDELSRESIQSPR